MPELPEVEVVKRELSELLKESPRIEAIEFMRKDLRDPMPIAKIKKMIGARVLSVKRRAKYLLLETDKGGLLSHLGMTGTWRAAEAGDELVHDHIYIQFSGGLRLAFRDPRRFGIFETFDVQNPQSSPRLKFLGPEPLEADFSASYLHPKLRSKKAPIKTAIMDQKLVVGVGNIYASEALFRAGIKPQRRADKVSFEKCEILVSKIKEVLSESILRGGSSISDFKATDGAVGSYQEAHQVYDRKDQDCVICGTRIRHLVQAGRSTYWCPSCQV